MSRRLQRVAERIRQELGRLLPTLKHPELGFLTVTKVEITADLQQAKVYVSVLPTREHEDPERSMKALHRSAGFLRREVGDALGLRVSPELWFLRDESVERAAHMTRLIRDARASDADQTPGPDGEDASRNASPAEAPEETNADAGPSPDLGEGGRPDKG